jgi:hypothetical protein
MAAPPAEPGNLDTKDLGVVIVADDTAAARSRFP